jgi:hypothetical protein
VLDELIEVPLPILKSVKPYSIFQEVSSPPAVQEMSTLFAPKLTISIEFTGTQEGQ